MEMLEAMSSIHGDDEEYAIEEGASKRRGGASAKDKSSKASYIEKNALLRGEFSNINAEKS